MELNLLTTPDKYIVVKENEEVKGPVMMMLPQKYPESIYVDVPKDKQNIPLSIKMYIGGLSIIGLYIVYRLIQKSR